MKRGAPEYSNINDVPYTELLGSDSSVLRVNQIARGKESCFMTDKRLLCKDEGCDWREKCCRLIAVWRR